MAAEFFFLMSESCNDQDELASLIAHLMEDDYPTELLDSDTFPSSRLLALTSKMVADKEIRWLPWKFRLSAKAQDDSLLIRPKKLPRLSELSDLLLDEAPSRDIHDGPASFNLINQLLTLATNSIALCRTPPLNVLLVEAKAGPTSSAGKWLSTLFVEGKQRTLHALPGQCKEELRGITGHVSW
ncbi:hypothetical protein AK812_SmicGene20396 [Symbiodinium microadriaticum]|uniref:Uncharacterized protein n=1 Tax=Symbiodinium microadriaticum TaxID=2951 RepID=A0A1Q9DQ74_SYMMI|nr:hypothetical protein AK812_SmicGene20396 [Symbiodinium microadriaticum]